MSHTQAQKKGAMPRLSYLGELGSKTQVRSRSKAGILSRLRSITLHLDEYKMASQKPAAVYPSPPPSPAKGKVDPILRNALRYTISQKEYEILHRYLLTRSPPAIRKKAPPPEKYHRIVQKGEDYNAAALRTSLRVFVISQAGLQLWDRISTRWLARGKQAK